MIAFQIWVSTIIFGLLGMIWGRDTWYDALVKFALLGLTIVGILILYRENGFSGIPMK
ncbi:hypothetical protein phiAS5_ORF0195 [Aeromonas phage phiAS5]|uniref:Uncharacterized protein n=1 Tax=Aeromonas phage phiAS5 TaxID=879630 RepID=E1A2U2_9CAUD|nr:hypothetical protein phiAS5_ORF0195 [Aeromonas phage phiAS5]ADM80038.1 hypothetical protein phiAS5_ORF0195 [Aeromonas phage phiAS5]BES53192.1 hypothetical protein [Aeromonas phage phiWae14]